MHPVKLYAAVAEVYIHGFVLGRGGGKMSFADGDEMVEQALHFTRGVSSD